MLLSGTDFAELAPLQALTNLQTLYCCATQVSDLAPLQDLPDLRLLNCSRCSLASVPDGLWLKPSLENLLVYKTNIPGIPREVLSQLDFGQFR